MSPISYGVDAGWFQASGFRRRTLRLSSNVNPPTHARQPMCVLATMRTFMAGGAQQQDQAPCANARPQAIGGTPPALVPRRTEPRPWHPVQVLREISQRRSAPGTRLRTPLQTCPSSVLSTVSPLCSEYLLVSARPVPSDWEPVPNNACNECPSRATSFGGGDC